MAKRKTPKVENLRPEKVTNEQLTKIRSIVDRINSSQLEIGRIEARKHQILHQVAGVNAE